MEMISKIATAFSHGGIWMWPILGIQLVSLSIIIERTYVLFFKRKLNQNEVVSNFEDSIRRGEIAGVIEKAKSMETLQPIARAVLAGAKAAKVLGGKEEIQGKMDEVLLHENAMIERRTGFLTMFGNVATLMGLLGTITGMIQSFAAVAFASPTEKAALLAAGISEAMNCTAYGLITAIPALIAYAILQNRANHIAEDLNTAALKAFNWLSYTYEPAGFQSFRSSKNDNHREVNA
jgi:biopolymer transport protein ExbB/TolQ